LETNSRPIGLLDSGIGGVPYLNSLRTALPDEEYVYVADRANFPYGRRDAATVSKLVHTAIGRMIEQFAPKMVIVACNTASVIALASLRSEFDVPFVGVVPAIKPAAEVGRDGPIGVLATNGTVEDAYVKALIANFATGRDVILIPAGDLVTLVEEHLFLAPPHEIRSALDEPMGRLRESGATSVVLGCTHFIHLREEISRMAGRAIRVIDSVDGVVRQAIRVCGSVGYAGPSDRSSGGPPGSTHFVVTGCATPPANYERLSAVHGLEIACDDWSGTDR
jgi:glutamate racemase